MAPQYRRAVFIFRRDLRLVDNTGLNLARTSAASVLPLFVFDPRQINHAYFSKPGFSFLKQSVKELDTALKLQNGALLLCSGTPDKVLKTIYHKSAFDLVVFNTDYTPFSKSRDEAITTTCKELGVECIAVHDALLHPPGTVLSTTGKPYTIFTPFWKKAATFPVNKPSALAPGSWALLKEVEQLKLPFREQQEEKQKQQAQQGGREEGVRILTQAKRCKDYKTMRDIPSVNGTSQLSAHLKFGTISVRETYHTLRSTLGDTHPLLRQLYWRDFFTHIAYFFPHVFGHSFHKVYDAIVWSNDERANAAFARWCNGTTGFPIVDAGLRELNATGLMHNRVRMITASFLVKDLHIDWRKGEQYFAQHLLDYDPCVNNGNWQWCASTGCDAQPYFRIFNPWLQQQRFDPDCQYIKKWVPELAQLTPKAIHQLFLQQPLDLGSYPKPIVEHKEAASHAKALFAAIAQKQ